MYICTYVLYLKRKQEFVIFRLTRMKIYRFVLLRHFRRYFLQHHRRRPDVRRTDSIVLQQRSEKFTFRHFPGGCGKHGRPPVLTCRSLFIVVYTWLSPPTVMMPVASFRSPLPSAGSTTIRRRYKRI